MGRSLEIQRPHAWRSRQYFAPRCRSSTLAIRLALALLFLALFHERHIYHSSRNDLRAKYSPTEFATPEATLWRTGIADLELPSALLDHRGQWKVLGTGWEGRTFAFNGSVIKTFVPGRSPFRNCVSRYPTVRWPTEIPASLEFGGIWDPDGETEEDASTNITESRMGFLPVKGYFMASSSTGARPEWHLVTPLLPGGNLNDLARMSKAELAFEDFRQVDSVYRGAFNKLLGTLESLHSRGFCHDDIKPANIFIKDDHNWVLGDLGNVRHTSHPYHASGLWLRDNKQLPDCRANDAVRALKTYLQLVRGATKDTASFDTAFFEKKQSLSRLFWWTLEEGTSMSAAEMKILSEVLHPKFVSDGSIGEPDIRRESSALALGRRKTLSYAVEEALRTSFSERATRWAAMTWIFGVPVEEC